MTRIPGIHTVLIVTLACFVLAGREANASQKKEARITQVIQDVKLLPGNAAPRPAAVNDDVREGTAVRTGQDSRTELTFSDQTLTRLGANSVFSFSGEGKAFDLGQGSILMQVPPNGSTVKVKTAAVTAAITGGTALFGAGPPIKFMVLEGTGTFYPTGHPEQAVTLHSGEMMMLAADGKLVGPTGFDVKAVLETSELIVNFPDLANLWLIWQVIMEQQADQTNGFKYPQKDIVEVTDQSSAASSEPTPPESPTPTPATPTPTPATPTPTPGKFGPPSTITSPVPYVINNTTAINTDPTITTNGVTDFGTIYRGPAQDGSEFDFLFGSTNSFDTTIGEFFNTNGNGVPVAVFKFSSLQLIGNPTITIPSGSTTFLGLVSVGDVTSGPPGGTLTFAGLDRLFIATQDGSITLGPEIAFSGIGHVTFYARGSGSNLTLGSAISGAAVVHLFAEGTVQVNGDITASNDFHSFSGGDFLAGSGIVTTTNLDIQSLSNITVHTNQYQGPVGGGGTINLNAANTLTIIREGSGNGSQADSLTAQATTIDFQSSTLNTVDIPNVSFTAGSGGIQAPNVLFASGDFLLLQTTNGGDINIYGRESPSNGQGGNVSVGTIDAAGAVNATTNITNVRDLSAGTSISVGGDLGADSVTAGTTVHVGGNIYADTLSAGGNIDASGVQVITINAPTSVLTVGDNGIQPVVRGPEGAARQHTFNVDSIVSPSGIDFSGNQFDGIGGLSSGGLLTINVNAQIFGAGGIAFANFDGADVDGFPNGGPATAGSGGTFIVNAAGDVLIDSRDAGPTISATTGIVSDIFSEYAGAGGTVHITATGSITVNGTVLVSSDDAGIGARPEGEFAGRESASGGNITLTSTSATGTAISIGSNAELLSLLGTGARGPGGVITIEATDPSSASSIDIDNANGVIEADGGLIDIIHQGDFGVINISNANIRADVIKITAFGINGTLNIGGGIIQADTMLKLYAAGSNGSINFTANVTLSSQSMATLIQAVSVTIVNGVIVTIAGPLPAEVWTDNPNYASLDTNGNPTGGNDHTTGQFSGSGANTSPFTGPTPTPPPSPKFGPPATITSPDPYVITSGTVINTDPTITTGVTDDGTIYRNPSQDGPRATWMFGSTSPFDITSGFASGPDSGNMDNMAVFKFTSLQITDNPTVNTTGADAVGNLGFIGVNGITIGPGGTLTFDGVSMLLLATQNGSINLGLEVSFSGLDRMHIYARGTGSNLTIGSAISTNSDLRLYSEGTVQVNGNVDTANFSSFSGGDWLNGSGQITAGGVYITSLGNITLDGEDIPDVDGGAISLNATGILTISITGGTNTRESFDLFGATINLTSDTPVVLDLISAINPSINAGAGGIQGPNVGLIADNMTLQSDGDINLYSFLGHNSTISGTANAAGAFNATSNVEIGSLTTGTSVFVGGDLFVSTVDAGTTIDVTGHLQGFQVTAGGNVTAGRVRVLNIDAPTGILTAGTGGIIPLYYFPGGENPQHTFNVSTIVSSGGIDFSGFNYYYSGLSEGGKLTINATTIAFDAATGIGFANFNGADAGTLDGGAPAEGGSGGTLIVNTTGNITTTLGADITATTGLNSDAGVYSGAGGNVTLNSSAGTVAVNNTIEVSSDDGGAQRQSASGGNITLHSGLTTGLGVSIGGNAQLLSLLGDGALGSGGTILITTAGADIHMGEFSGAFLTADRGTIDIHQTAPGSGGTSMIEIYNTFLSAETISIASSGDFELGIEGFVIVDGVTITLTAANNLDMEVFFDNATAEDSDGNVIISAGNNLTILDDLNITRTNGGRDSGVNITLSAGAAMSVTGSLFLTTNPDGLLDGGNILVTASTINVTGDIGLITDTLEDAGTGGNITLTGDITTHSLRANVWVGQFAGRPPVLLPVFDPVTLTSGGNITVTAPGGLNLSTGSFIPGSSLSISVADFGEILTGGNITLTVGTLLVPANLLSNAPFEMTINTSSGGHIGTGGNISATVHGNFTATGLLLDILNSGGRVDSGGAISLIVDGTLTTTAGDANLTLNNSGGGTIGGDARIDISAANVSISGNLDVTIDNTGGSIGGNAIINFGASGNINAGDATFQILNSDNGSSAGTIASAATINVTTGGDFTANSLFGFINDRHPGFIGGAATVGLDVGGALMISNDVSMGISMRNDGSGGGTVSSDASVNLDAGSVSVGGAFTTFLSTNAGGSITGNATNRVNVTGDFVVQGPILLDIEDTGFNQVDPINFIAGGHIGGNATVTLSAQNITTFSTASGIPGTDTMALEASIYPNGSGTIGGDAIVNVLASQNISAPGTAFFTVANGNYLGTGGGTIGGDAKINVSAVNISTGPLFADIYNYGGGSIGGSANINFNLSGNLTTQSDAKFLIDNSNGGTIGSDATIDVNAANISAGGFLQALIENTNGSVGGAGLSLLTTGTITIGDFLEAFIFNDGGHIVTGGDVTVHAVGDMNVGASAFFGISNVGGTIDSSPVVDISANNISVGGFLEAYIDNTNGIIGGDSVTLHADGTITVGATLDVFGTVTAGGDINAQTLSSTDVASSTSINAGSGGIRQFQFPSGIVAANVLHTLTAPAVTSTGGIIFSGLAATATAAADDGGQLTINADSLSIGAFPVAIGPLGLTTGDIMGPVTFNGGDGSSTFDPASGGTFTVNTTGAIDVNSDIEATSGHFQQAPSATPAGFGGTVNLNSTNGTVTVNNRIEVSSAEPASTSAPFRQSNSGGNIKITSGKTGGSAINVGSTAQLLSLLDTAATGGGTIELSATGGGSSIDIDNFNGSIEADQGTIDINHQGNNGIINISNANMIADVIKIQLFGDNGVLTIGGGIIDANSALTLYAAGGSGSIVFNANVTLTSNSAAIIAANTVTINNGFTVFIDSTHPALVYANVRNYDVAPFGSFTGAGATSQPFDPDNPPLVAQAGTVGSPSAMAGSNPATTPILVSELAPAGAQNSASGGVLLAASQPAAKRIVQPQGASGQRGVVSRRLEPAADLPRAHRFTTASRTTARPNGLALNVSNSAQLLTLLEAPADSGGRMNFAPKPRSRSQKSGGTRTTRLNSGKVGASYGNSTTISEPNATQTAPARNIGSGPGANTRIDNRTSSATTGRPVGAVSY